MLTGVVSWFNPTKGLGFIEPDNGDSQVIVRAEAVIRADIPILEFKSGVKVEFQIVTDDVSQKVDRKSVV